MDELECLILPQILGRLEADAEADAGRLQRLADLLEPPLVELEVLVVRPLVARRGHRGNATRATGGNRRLGIVRQLLQVLGKGLVVGLPVQGQGEAAQLQLGAIDQPAGILHALQPRPGGKFDDVQVHAPEAVS